MEPTYFGFLTRGFPANRMRVQRVAAHAAERSSHAGGDSAEADMAAVAIRRAREAPSLCSDLSRRGLWNDWTLDCWANSAGSIAVAGSMACAYFSETHSIHASAKPSASRRPLARKYLSYAGHSMGRFASWRPLH